MRRRRESPLRGRGSKSAAFDPESLVSYLPPEHSQPTRPIDGQPKNGAEATERANPPKHTDDPAEADPAEGFRRALQRLADRVGAEIDLPLTEWRAGRVRERVPRGARTMGGRRKTVSVHPNLPWGAGWGPAAAGRPHEPGPRARRRLRGADLSRRWTEGGPGAAPSCAVLAVLSGRTRPAAAAARLRLRRARRLGRPRWICSLMDPAWGRDRAMR
jgi:hypothetical protein